MSKIDQTGDEVMLSLTGFDEIAITQRFGRTIEVLSDDRSMMGRALVFITERRDGKTDDAAYTAALEMTLGDVLAYFAEETEESGKDEAPPEPSLVMLPPSAS